MPVNQLGTAKSARIRLPDEVFEFIRELYPFFFHVLERCSLTGPQFLALSHLRNSRVTIDGRPAMLISGITSVLQQAGGYGPSRASMIIIELHSKRLLDKMDIDPKLRRDLFRETHLESDEPQKKGKNKVVVIRPEGLAILDQLNEQVSRLFDELLGSAKLPKTLISYALRHLPHTARELARAARQQAQVLQQQTKGPGHGY